MSLSPFIGLKQARSTPPSLRQFYSLSIIQYAATVLSKIRTSLSTTRLQVVAQQRKETTKYNKISDQQLFRRGCFLAVIHQYFSVVNSIYNHYRQLQQENHSEGQGHWDYQAWLQDMPLSIQELTNLSKIKQELQQLPLNSTQNFCKQLLPLLFETQIYVFQIYLRILIYEIHKKERQSYECQLIELRKKFKSIVGKYQQEVAELQEVARSEPLQLKNERRKKKALWKQINQLIGFYQCEQSINRQDCRNKPELHYLLELLKDKLSQDVFKELIQNTTFKQIYQRTIIKVQAANFTPFIIVPIQAAPEENTPSKQLKLNIQKLQSINITINEGATQSSTRYKTKTQTNQRVQSKEELKIHQTESKFVRRQNHPRSQKDGQEQAERETKMRRRQQQENKERILKQRYKAHKSHIAMANLTNQQKLEFIGWNQRFSQNICNLTRRIVKVKKEVDIDYAESEKSQKCSRDYLSSPVQPHLPKGYDSTDQIMKIVAKQALEEGQISYQSYQQ